MRASISRLRRHDVASRIGATACIHAASKGGGGDYWFAGTSCAGYLNTNVQLQKEMQRAKSARFNDAEDLLEVSPPGIVSAMGTHEIRDRLSDSSRAFLKRATEELETSPRNAVVDLCAGVELLMKARLAHEHWSLVADRPGDVPIDKMEKGDFESVGFRKAIDRVEIVTRSNFPKADKALLRRLGDHRNMVVHFYHPELSTDDPTLLAAAAAEQCRAWMLVERLITKDWADAFKGEQHLWIGLKARFNSNTTFLRQKFVSIEPELMALMKEDVVIEDCHSCGFLASKRTPYPHCTFALSCLLCNAFNHIARVACPTCGNSYIGEADVAPYCERCDRYLWDQMGLATEATAQCQSCTGFVPTVHAALQGNGGFCSSCLDTGEVGKCPYCDTPWMLRFSDDFLEGCSKCESVKQARRRPG